MNPKPFRGSVDILRWIVALCCLLHCVPRSSAQQVYGSANSTGTLSGMVVDTQGALISGARLKLSQAPGAPDRQATSTSDGSFLFDHVAPGDFILSVVLQGFVSTSVTGSLQPSQNLEVAPVTLKMASAVFVVKVIPDSPYQASKQLLVEEKQRLLGFVPNFFVSYQWNAPPLTTKQKFTLAWKNGEDPGNLLLVGTVAGVQQGLNDFSGYGQGAQGYGKRYGADLANLEVGTFMGGAVLPSLFHQDPRYFYKGTGTIRSRILYALSSAIICRGDNGRRQPAFAGVLGDLSAGAISNIYYPSSNRGVGLTLENGFLGVAGDALNGLFQEFFLRKLTPGANKKSSQTP